MKKGQYAMTKKDVIKSFISYAVGCSLGRYSPFSAGLFFAGGTFDLSSYHDFIPDGDNVVPMLDDSWFSDDMTNQFINFLRTVYGEESLETNIAFIEKSLGKSLGEYFAKEFYDDHLKRYRMRPIYWMFSSPKGHFNALVYIHRYNDKTANIVLPHLRAFRDKMKRKETKKVIKYQNMDKDLNDYESTLYLFAVEHLTFDIADGVKANYQKFKEVLEPLEMI